MNKVTFLIAAGFLSGCTLFERQEPLPLYVLESGTFQHTKKLSVSLAIDEPLSETSLNTQRIALTPAPYQRDYLGNGEWPDRLPKVFQSILLQGFEQKWGAENVNRTSSGLEAKYLLSSEIEDFSVQHVAATSPEVYLQVTFKLIDLKERKVVSAKTFKERVVIPSFTMQEIVSTFNKSVHCLIDKAGAWTEATLKIK